MIEPRQDPSKPKRSFATFLYYASQKVVAAQKETPDAKFGDIASALSAEYKALKEPELKVVAAKLLEKPLTFTEMIEGFDHSDEPKKKKAKKDPLAPKRNMSAYFLYSISARPKVKADNPDASFGDIARLLSEKFKSLPDKDKKKWDKAAQKDKERYEKEMAEYNK